VKILSPLGGIGYLSEKEYKSSLGSVLIFSQTSCIQEKRYVRKESRGYISVGVDVSEEETKSTVCLCPMLLLTTMPLYYTRLGEIS